MSTKYIASNWRLPNEENSNKSDNYDLSFDGTEFIDCGSNLFNNSTISSISISCWIKTTSGSSNAIISKDLATAGNKNFMLQLSGNDLYWQTSTDGASFQNLQLTNAEFDLLDGNWHNIIATYNAGSTSADGEKLIYVDGVLRKTDPAATLNNIYNTTSVDINIGRKGDATRFFNGSISELSIFNYALSSTQVSTLYGSSSLGAGNPMALKPQPVAYYPLGDNSASNPLTQPNEAVEDASVFDFDGSNKITGTGALISGNESRSFSLWYKTSSTAAQIPFSLGSPTDQTNGAQFAYCINRSSTTNAAIFGKNSAYDTSVFTVPYTSDGNWHHLLVTYDQSALKVFIDGNLEATPALPSTSYITSAGFTIGGWTIVGNRLFNGEISNVAVWNSDQSSEISNIYNSGVPATSYTNTPTAWYKLDQSANWEADSTGAWQIPDAVSAYPQSFDFVSADGDRVLVAPVDAGTGPINSINGAITVAIWVKTTQGTVYEYAINRDYVGGSNRDWNLFKDNFYGGGGRMMWSLFNTSGSNLLVRLTGSTDPQGDPLITMNDGKWHHIVGVYNGTDTAELYTDGILQGSATSSGFGTLRTNARTVIGGYNNSSNPFSGGGSWNGGLSNAQIWDTNLNATQVETLYNNGVPLTTAIASDNLKLWAKLDNTATFSTNWSIPDASGNGNTGTSSGMTEQNLVNNNVSILNGESSGMTSANLVLSDLSKSIPYDSYSFNFDGSTDKITLGSSISTGNNYTVSFWLNPDNVASGNSYIFSDSTTSPFKGLALDQGSSTAGGFGNFYYYTGSVIVVNNTAISGDVWSHIAIVFDITAQEIKFYINGSLDKTTTSVANIGTSIDEFGIRSTGNAFNGKLSNISIFNEELTSTEVLKLYANGVPQDLTNFNPQPVAFYPLGSNSFWNGSQWTVRDMIGSNDGTGQNIGIDGLVGDSPRSSANGVGTNNSIPENLVGTTKWSELNSWSINMSSEARTTDVP